MRSITVLPARPVSVSEMASFFESRFDGCWFPEYRRFSLEADASYVFFDHDQHFAEHNEQGVDDQTAATGEAQVGARPASAMHVQISSYNAGSRELAGKVIQAMLEEWGGVVLEDADLESS